MPSVMAIVEWPSRSCTTRGWMPLSSAKVAPRVTQPLQRQRRQAGILHPADERSADGVGLEAGAVGLVEHEASVLEVGADEHALLDRALPVLAQHGNGAGIEGDRPAASRCLRLADGDLAAHLDDRLHDTEAAGVEVHVETDPSIIWAGMPPWIGAGFLVPLEADVSSPPGHYPDWRTWARSVGGVDETLTQLRVTLTARKDLLVVVDGVRVRVHARKHVPPWRSITCGVGGADVSPRRAEVQLSGFNPPTFSWVDESGDVIAAPTFSVSGSEAEMLHIWAYVEDEWVEWTAELLVLVDGRRQTIDINDRGRPFVTTGSQGALSHHMWASGGDRWDPPLSS